MRFSARYVPAILLALLSLTASEFAQTVTRQTAKAPRGTVSGRVTIKEKPAAGVLVGMRRSDNFMPFEQYQKAATDQDGFYRIGNVAAGSYEVVLSAPAYVMADLKDSRSRSVIVGEDENVEGINFALVRGGVITGRVTDADGRPVIQQQVNLYTADAFDQPQPQAPGQQRPIFAASSGQTDDRGIYRIFGLSAGRYKVAAGRSEDTFSGTFGPYRATYKQVFYPDVSEQAKATVIEVKEGSEAGNIDITLGRALQTFSASGRVVDGEKGQPIPNMRFGLQRASGQRAEFVSSLAASNAQGDFIVEGLIPGKYSVSLLPGQGNDLRAESFSFDVLDQDVTGLTIRLSKGASLNGVLTLETEDRIAHEKLLQLQLRAFVMTGTGGAAFGSSAMSPIAPDGSFRLAGLPGGSVNLNLGSMTMPLPPKGFSISLVQMRPEKEAEHDPAYLRWFGSSGSPDSSGSFSLFNLQPGRYQFDPRFYARYWYVESITLGAAPPATVPKSQTAPSRMDVASNWTVLKAGEKVNNLTIKLAEGAASIRGRLPLAEGAALPTGMAVYVVPLEPEKTEDVLRFFVAGVSADGTFTLNNLPPGKYRVLAQTSDPQTGTLLKLREPEAAHARAKLRKAAETKKSEIELKPCQNLAEYQLKQ